MIVVFIALALLCAANTTQTPPPVEEEQEVRIGDVVGMPDPDEVADPDPVYDANAPGGWYRKTQHGWVYVSDEDAPGSKPPTDKLAAFMGSQTAESVGGLLCIAAPLLLIISFKRRKKKRVVPDGVSQAQTQAIIRELHSMARILNDVVPENGDGMKVVERRRR